MIRSSHYDVLILGGGVVGLALAAALGQGGLKVGVLDREAIERDWPEDSWDLRVSAITRASQNFFRHVGAWSGMRALRVSPYERMQVWDAGGGAVGFDAAELAEPDLGHIVENRVLRRALFEAMSRHGQVDWLCPAVPRRVDADGELARLELEDGRTLRARLLVGADGARSWLREQIGIGHAEREYGHTALVAMLRTEQPHQATAWQRFLPDGVLAFLPLSDPHRCSIVWSTHPDRAEALKTMAVNEFERELAFAFERRLGRVELVSARAGFPLAMRHAHAYVAPRVALIGDAAHTIHPLAGQGVNLGLMDAAALAQRLLTAHRAGRDLGAVPVLRPYERARRGENLAVIAAMDAFKRLYAVDAPPLRLVRGWGMKLFDRMTPLKHLAIRRAMGLSGDVPDLARAEPRP